MTLSQFEGYKDEQGIEEWDYPLEEYGYIAERHKEDGNEYVPVKFADDVRFCEILNN